MKHSSTSSIKPGTTVYSRPSTLTLFFSTLVSRRKRSVVTTTSTTIIVSTVASRSTGLAKNLVCSLSTTQNFPKRTRQTGGVSATSSLTIMAFFHFPQRIKCIAKKKGNRGRRLKHLMARMRVKWHCAKPHGTKKSVSTPT